MDLREHVPLRDFSTMRLGGSARYLLEIHSRQEVASAYTWAETNKLPTLMIGGGSNIVWRDEGFPGLVLVNKIMRYEVFQEDDLNVYLTLGAGENWDSVVERAVAAGLSGIEALSLVPGSTGATPVQNVGAYGQEISQTITVVEAYDTQAKTFVNIPPMDCDFGYRSSRFKTRDRGRFFITGITLHLMHTNPQPPFYKTLQEYLQQHGTHEYTPQSIRDAVIAIRSAKLPDPAVVANNGSFFANPVIDDWLGSQLLEIYPDMPHWPAENGQLKIPAAWLIEHAGFKDYHDQETGMATWPHQPLVFVNEHARSTADLLKFRQKVLDTVAAKFQITLEQEPELLP